MLVPIEPDAAMLDAGDLFFTNASFVNVSPAQIKRIYSDMLGAAPDAPSAATSSATAITENDARYQWLRVRGCAIDGTEHQREGLVRRCINLDEEIDSLRAVDIGKAAR